MELSMFFQVRAVTDAGLGSLATVDATPSSPPGQPTGLGITGTPGQIAATWIAPEEDGGAGIKHYLIQYKISSEEEWSDPEIQTQLSHTFNGLNQTVAYVIRVAAVNNADQTGAWSEVSEAIIPGDISTAPRTAPFRGESLGCSW